MKKVAETLEYLQKCSKSSQYRPSGAGGGRGGRGGVSPPKDLLMYPFLLMSPLNVLFLKDVTKNIDENQQAKSRAS